MVRRPATRVSPLPCFGIMARHSSWWTPSKRQLAALRLFSMAERLLFQLTRPAEHLKSKVGIIRVETTPTMPQQQPRAEVISALPPPSRLTKPCHRRRPRRLLGLELVVLLPAHGMATWFFTFLSHQQSPSAASALRFSFSFAAADNNNTDSPDDYSYPNFRQYGSNIGSTGASCFS